jgi:hypothetical protein
LKNDLSGFRVYQDESRTSGREGFVRQNYNIGDARESNLVNNDFDFFVLSSAVCEKIDFPFGASAQCRSYQIGQLYRLGFAQPKEATSIPSNSNTYGVLAYRPRLQRCASSLGQIHRRVAVEWTGIAHEHDQQDEENTKEGHEVDHRINAWPSLCGAECCRFAG